MSLLDDFHAGRDGSPLTRVGPSLREVALVHLIGDDGEPISEFGSSDGATEATLLDVLASLAILDDWDESDRAKVNLIAGQAGIAADEGAPSAATPRVVEADYDTEANPLTGTVDATTLNSDTTYTTGLSNGSSEALYALWIGNDSDQPIEVVFSDATSEATPHAFVGAFSERWIPLRDLHRRVTTDVNIRRAAGVTPAGGTVYLEGHR